MASRHGVFFPSKKKQQQSSFIKNQYSPSSLFFLFFFCFLHHASITVYSSSSLPQPTIHTDLRLSRSKHRPARQSDAYKSVYPALSYCESHFPLLWRSFVFISFLFFLFFSFILYFTFIYLFIFILFCSCSLNSLSLR